METDYKLGKIESIFWIVLLLVSKLIANIPFYFSNTVSGGVITNFIYIGIIDFLFLLLIIKLQKKFQNLDIIDISEFVGGKIFKLIIGIVSIAVLFLASFITLKSFSTIIEQVYFSNFSIIYILLFFILAALISNIIGFKSTSRINLLIIPFVIIAIFITFFSILNKINIKTISPIFGESYYQTFITGFSNIFMMSNLTYILFFKPLLKEPSDYKKICIIAYFISWVCALLVIIATSFLFGTTSAKIPANSVFLLVRLVSFGNFIERIDSLFILLCVISIFNYLGFVIFIINRIIKKLFNISDEKMLSFSNCNILFAITLLPISIAEISFFENIIYRYAIISYTFVLCLIILIIANIKKEIRKEKI